MQNIFLKDVMVAFIQSIDLVNCLLKKHHGRVAIIAYEIGKAYGLPEDELKQLVLAASIHDIGALTVSERNDLIRLDIENPHPHAILGALMLESFPPFERISHIIRYHHWKWSDNGNGSLYSDDVPETSYLLHLADRVDILIAHDTWILSQKDTVRNEIVSHRGTLFRPECVDAFLKVSEGDEFWLDIENKNLSNLLNELMVEYESIEMDDTRMEELAYTLSRIIDYRSAFTATHSFGVGLVAAEIGRLMDLPQETCANLKIAGYLHDIGKIGIPPEIVEKKSCLEEDEYQVMKAHAYYTRMILQNIKGMEEICEWASMHHERHDGSGYPQKLSDAHFSLESDIIAYADIFTALSEDRPYRSPFEIDDLIETLESEYKPKLGDMVFDVVKNHARHLNGIRQLGQTEAFKAYQKALFQSRSGM